MRGVHRHGLVRTFAIPAALASLSLFGLIAALIGDGPWDLAGWLGLAAPCVAVVSALARARSGRS